MLLFIFQMLKASVFSTVLIWLDPGLCCVFICLSADKCEERSDEMLWNPWREQQVLYGQTPSSLSQPHLLASTRPGPGSALPALCPPRTALPPHNLPQHSQVLSHFQLLWFLSRLWAHGFFRLYPAPVGLQRANAMLSSPKMVPAGLQPTWKKVLWYDSAYLVLRHYF